MTVILLLTVGGALGVNLRYWLGVWIVDRVDPHFPWATFAINISGAFLIGLLAPWLARSLPDPRVRVFLLTGVLGGYTTFSSFTLETLTLWERGDMGRAAAYLVFSNGLGILAVALGAWLGRG